MSAALTVATQIAISNMTRHTKPCTVRKSSDPFLNPPAYDDPFLNPPAYDDLSDEDLAGAADEFIEDS